MRKLLFFFVSSLTCISLKAELPDAMLTIMHQPKYEHSTWGVYVRDADTGRVLYDLNADQMFLPASTTKLFSVAALLHAYGDSYRFKTPVYANGTLEDGHFQGDLILVGQGDLTFGGRQQGDTDQIAFTTLDHINANEIPGVTLTPQNPLYGLNQLAKQIRDKGIIAIDGDILIDNRLFETTEKRGSQLSPTMLNENLIDLVINPTIAGSQAQLSWRPQVPGYAIVNQVKTVAKGDPVDIEISADESGRNIVVKGTVPVDQKDLVRTFSIKDPANFVREAFIQALRNQGIVVTLSKTPGQLPTKQSLTDKQPLAMWTSPPLSEYGKLILKVSHNIGANLIPLLLAAHEGKSSFAEGMLLLGNFVVNNAKIAPNTFVFIDGAGGDDNRLTPNTEVLLLHYIKSLPQEQFQSFYNSLPILGVDGSLADFGKNTTIVGKMRAKPGTGMSINLATRHPFLTTQAFSGYIEAKNGHLIEFMIVVNNSSLTAITDVFAIFEDFAQLSAAIHDAQEV